MEESSALKAARDSILNLFERVRSVTGGERRGITLGIITILALSGLASLLFVIDTNECTAPAEAEYVSNSVPNIESEDHVIYVAVWVINSYNFEYKTGSYLLDLYVSFYWTDQNVTTVNWFLMNGYPLPGEKRLVSENLTGAVKSQTFRVRCNMDAQLTGKYYPFAKIGLPIVVELLEHDYELTLVWLESETGIDADYSIEGWSHTGFNLTTSGHVYPNGEVFPRVTMTIFHEKKTLPAVTKTIFPPLMFCVVSAFSFLVRLDDDNGFSLRVGLNTSMLITAILFNLTEVSEIPPMTFLTLYAAFIVSVFLFLALNLIVTIVGNVSWRRRQDKKLLNRINLIGFAVSVAVPVVLFVALSP